MNGVSKKKKGLKGEEERRKGKSLGVAWNRSLGKFYEISFLMLIAFYMNNNWILVGQESDSVSLFPGDLELWFYSFFPDLQKQARNDSEAASGSGRLFVEIPRMRPLLISACREFVFLDPLPPSCVFLLFFSPIIPELQAVFHPLLPTQAGLSTWKCWLHSTLNPRC